MEKSQLRPELKSIVDQFTKFRNEYSNLKTDYVAQEELIRLQKMELERLNKHVEKLATTLLDYQRRFNSTLNQLVTENRRLRKNVEDLNREQQNSRLNDNLYIHEANNDSNDDIRRLEEELENLRNQMTSENQRHEERIKSLTLSHENEILELKTKLNEANEKLRFSTATKRIGDEYKHPAFDNDTVRKRKKNTGPAFRWPELEVSTKKGTGSGEKPVQKRKKKLFQPDNDEVVDL